MRVPSLVLALSAVLLAVPPAVFADSDDDEAGTNFQILGAYKALNDNDWDPADEQTGYGVQFDVQPDNWDFSFAAGFIAAESSSEETEIPGIGRVTSKSRTTELNLGIRKYLYKDELRPFIGVGLSFVRAELETTTPVGSDSDSGTGVGPWVGLGCLYMVSDWMGIGGQLQYSTAEAEVFGEDLDAGALQADALLNFHF